MKSAVLLVISAAAASLVCSAWAQVAAGDGRMIKPYAGSVLLKQEVKEYDEFVIPLGPRDAGKPMKSEKLTGRWTHLYYDVPAGRSDLEMAANYEAALKADGFEIVFKCRKAQCGAGNAPQPGLMYWPYDTSNYFAARKSEKGEQVWVALDARTNGTLINIIRVKAMQTGLVLVDAAALQKGIEETGHVAVYGIHFDTGKSELKPESKPALEEIARLLKQSPRLKIHVVGHTDSVGTLEANVTLSRNRAAAVVKELVSKYGIQESRLSPHGVGSLVPVATNRSEESRARNRRVDLVEQ